MSAAATETPATETNPAGATPDSLDALTARIENLTKSFDNLGKAAGNSVAAGLMGGQAPWGTTGALAGSRPYSILKAAAHCRGYLPNGDCKVEIDTHEKLKSLMERQGYRSHHPVGSFYVPADSAGLVAESSADEAAIAEITARSKGWHSGQYDPDEANYIMDRTGALGRQYRKSLGTVSDTAGGSMVGFPTLGEFVEMLRNIEVFSRAGATNMSLPANGQLTLPKQTNGATAYWVGEESAITSSQQTTGSLDLKAKKLGVLVKINNELLRFASPTTEGMVRTDMAIVSALKADVSMFSGTGGTQIKGLLTYPTQTTWTSGVDSLISHTATTVGADGNTMTSADFQTMVGKLPDTIGDNLKWLVRKSRWASIANLRAAAVTANDAQGQYLFNQFRALADRLQQQIVGYPAILSSNVPNDRVKGSGTALTCVVLGYFPDWIIARSPVVEFLANGLGDTPYVNDQTWLRGIQHLDAGPRHAASFAVCDTLTAFAA